MYIFGVLSNSWFVPNRESAEKKEVKFNDMILLRKPKKLSADVENGTQQEADDALIKKHYRKLLLRIMWNVYMHNQWF